MEIKKWQKSVTSINSQPSKNWWLEEQQRFSGTLRSRKKILDRIKLFGTVQKESNGLMLFPISRQYLISRQGSSAGQKITEVNAGFFNKNKKWFFVQ